MAPELPAQGGWSAYFFMSLVSGCMAVPEAAVVVAVDEPLSEHAERETTAKETRQTSMRYFIGEHYARGMPNVK
jgi:hypothetical protein